jgi:predicted secreted protein
MATHTGSEGTIKISSTTIGELRSYTLEQTGDTIEDTSMGDSSRTYKAGLKGFSGSASLFFDEADSGQLLIVVGTEIAIKVFPEGASSGDKFYEGNAVVTGYNISASFDGMVEAEMTFTGTGALSLSTQA